MTGKLSKENSCGAAIRFGDDYADNSSTFRCGLPPGHQGPHEETGDQYGQPYRLLFEKDSRETCAICKAKGVDLHLCAICDIRFCPACMGPHEKFADRCPKCRKETSGIPEHGEGLPY